MSDTKKLPTVRTPAGTAKYPRLTTPDTKFNPEGVYKCTLVLNEKDKGVSDFLNTIRDAHEASVADAKAKAKKGVRIKEADLPIRAVLDDDGNEVAGMVEVSAKCRASGISKKTGERWERKPKLFDAQGKPAMKANVGGGSKVKLAVQVAPFYTAQAGAGVTLRLEAVQIIDLVEFSGGGSASSYGFEAEDGYSATEDTFDGESPAAEDEGAEDSTTPRQRGDF